MDAAHHTTQLSFSLSPSFPSILSVCRDPMCVSQAVEHPFCLFYLFLLFLLLSLSLSLSHPSFPVFFLYVFHTNYFILSLLGVFFYCAGWCRARPQLAEYSMWRLEEDVEKYPNTVIRTSGEGCGRLQQCVCLSPLLLRKNIVKLLFMTIIDLVVIVLKS